MLFEDDDLGGGGGGKLFLSRHCSMDSISPPPSLYQTVCNVKDLLRKEYKLKTCDLQKPGINSM